MAYYPNQKNIGIMVAGSLGDGYSIHLSWHTAYPNNTNNKIAYHIYYSTNIDRVFLDGIKFVSINGSTNVDIFDFIPGQLYYFAVRAVEYDPNIVDALQLPNAFDGLAVYPESLLASNITDVSTTIPLLDAATFPDFGVVKVGVELIDYLSVDITNNTLNLTNANLQRGFYSTEARIHNTDGYDGYFTWSPSVSFLLGREETNTKIRSAQSHFEFFQDQFTITDGYHQVTKDILTTDLAGSDASNVGFNSYDYAGWHRTDPTLLLNGECVGLYIGGEQYCVDGYDGVGRVLRGISFQERNNQRQEILLGVTGEPVVLLKRQWTGITCECYLPSSEYPDDRCPDCYGTKFKVGWNQYFNPRISDGRIMVRFSPADDIVKQYDSGQESEMFADVWTMVVPTVKQRDIIVRFDQDDNEEFRYEVINVNRNRTLDRLSGGQHFRVQRIRKSDVAYQIPVFRNTQYLPQVITTGIGNAPGLGPHTHTFEISENFPNGTPQLTSQNAGHNHPITRINGVLTVGIVLGHTHILNI